MVTLFAFPLFFHPASFSPLFVYVASTSFLDNLFRLHLLQSVALSPQNTLSTCSSLDHLSSVLEGETSSSRDLCTLGGLLW